MFVALSESEGRRSGRDGHDLDHLRLRAPGAGRRSPSRPTERCARNASQPRSRRSRARTKRGSVAGTSARGARRRGWARPARAGGAAGSAAAGGVSARGEGRFGDRVAREAGKVLVEGKMGKSGDVSFARPNVAFRVEFDAGEPIAVPLPTRDGGEEAVRLAALAGLTEGPALLLLMGPAARHAFEGRASHPLRGASPRHARPDMKP